MSPAPGLRIDDARPLATSGSEAVASDEPTADTPRAHERAQEDAEFLSVIVKRNDEARRHPDDILRAAIEEGEEQLDRPTRSLALSAVAAGLILGFTAMAVGVVGTATADLDPLIRRLATAAVYPLGFMICIMSGTELFTEHTATAVYPVLDRRASVKGLLRLWAVVLVGNLVGAAAGGLLLLGAEPVIHASHGYALAGEHLVAYDTLPLIASSVLAGWLMALGGWLVLATPPTVAQLASIYLVTFTIGIGGLHHSIAGSVEAVCGWLIAGVLGPAEVVRFVATAAFGNLVGGSLLVGVLNYGHIRDTQEVEADA